MVRLTAWLSGAVALLIVVSLAVLAVVLRVEAAASSTDSVGPSLLPPPMSSTSPIIPIPSIANAIEAALISRSNSFYASCASKNATQMMTLLAPHSSAQTTVIGDATLGGVTVDTVNGTLRAGAAQVLQLAVFQGQTQYLNAAVAMVKQDIAIRIMQFRLWTLTSAAISDGGANGDVGQRKERGDIAWEAWLLHQAGAYFTAAPGQPAVNSTQQLIEQFTTDYVELLYNTTTWPCTGYNKCIAQGLHPAAMLAIYGQTAFQRLWPNTYFGFFQFWDDMLLGQQGSYEPDNSPDYGNFNVGMVLSMALWMNRVNRTAANASDPHAYLSDSVDVPRVLANLASEMMPNGNMVNYNRGGPVWTPETQGGSAYYSFSTAGTNAPFVLYMGYIIFRRAEWLYTGSFDGTPPLLAEPAAHGSAGPD